jgi:hypothetical protein
MTQINVCYLELTPSDFLFSGCVNAFRRSQLSARYASSRKFKK